MMRLLLVRIELRVLVITGEAAVRALVSVVEKRIGAGRAPKDDFLGN